VDDIPSAYHRALGGRGSNCLSRLKARTQRALLHRRERFFRDRFTTVSVCSEADRTYLGGEAVHVIPNGFARPAREPHENTSAHAPRIGFIGLYSYAPNLDGVRWFLKEVWPSVQRAVPGVRFRMIGKDTDGTLKPADAAVDALGFVADPADEIATWSAMVVPIRFGGGTRIKLADAFSRKCAVVSTPFGAYGYNVEHDKQVLLAEDAASFSASCIELLRNPPHARRLAETAWQEFLSRWTWDAISPKIWSAAEDCLRRSATLTTA
jgi:glycosyltransferase involved in cell wall biosynthesis